MPGVGLTTGLVLAAAGIGSATALDIGIDRARHDHDSTAYRHGSLPTHLLFGGGVAVTAAGLLSKLHPATRGASSTLLRVGAGTMGAWAATFGVRIGIGMLFDPAGTGMKWNPGDIAKNAVDRTHMMGVTSRPHEKLTLGWISELQGHGSYDERLAAGEFEPVWPK